MPDGVTLVVSGEVLVGSVVSGVVDWSVTVVGKKPPKAPLPSDRPAVEPPTFEDFAIDMGIVVGSLVVVTAVVVFAPELVAWAPTLVPVALQLAK